MHTNYRRKKGRHNPRRGVGWSNSRPFRGLSWEKRTEWKRARQQVRRLLHWEKWDLVPERYPPTILWNIW
jgi:hypothetical protein